MSPHHETTSVCLCQACGYAASHLEYTKAAAIIEAVKNHHLALIRRDLLTIVLFGFLVVVVVAGSAAVVVVA